MLRTLSSAPVRLFGWVAQNQAGVTYETLGINGAQASLMLEWNSSILDPELMSRDPALIVLAYGTNEALSRTWTAEEYRAALTEIIQRLRAAAPVASILLIGPPDCEYRTRGRRLPFPHLDQVIEIQREVAREPTAAPFGIGALPWADRDPCVNGCRPGLGKATTRILPAPDIA